MKECCDSMKLMLGKVKYDQFNWNLCGGLKVVALLLVKRLGHTKYCCLMYKWDSRDMKQHCLNKRWPRRTSQPPG